MKKPICFCVISSQGRQGIISLHPKIDNTMIRR